MISAIEARRQTLLHSKCKDVLNEVESQIMGAVKFGKDTISIHPMTITKDAVEAVKVELEQLGYKVTFEWAKPCPSGCPSDQWYSDNTLTVSWKEKVEVVEK